MPPRKTILMAAIWLVVAAHATAQVRQANMVVYEGTSGPGRGRHIVLIAGDQEYRSEEGFRITCWRSQPGTLMDQAAAANAIDRAVRPTRRAPTDQTANRRGRVA